jgi:hypothetical protein
MRLEKNILMPHADYLFEIIQRFLLKRREKFSWLLYRPWSFVSFHPFCEAFTSTFAWLLAKLENGRMEGFAKDLMTRVANGMKWQRGKPYGLARTCEARHSVKQSVCSHDGSRQDSMKQEDFRHAKQIFISNL